MERMAIIATEWNAEQLNPQHLYYLIEGGLKAGSESFPAPLGILGASRKSTLRRFVESAREALLFPEDSDFRATLLPGLRHPNVLLLSCGASHVCCLRSGRFLADFAGQLGLTSRLVIVPGPGELGAPRTGAAGLLKTIIQKRTDRLALEKLAEECLPHYFLAAGYVAGGFHSGTTGSGSEEVLLNEKSGIGAFNASTLAANALDTWWERMIQDFRNLSLGMSEN